MNNEEKEMTFESAIARLEEIVRLLESGSAPLDESLALFEEGVGLVKLSFPKFCVDRSSIPVLKDAKSRLYAYFQIDG